jgi:hypothetical protein
MTESVRAIVLTSDEERHIARCIGSIACECADVTVVDSGSSDAITGIALRLGAIALASR